MKAVRALLLATILVPILSTVSAQVIPAAARTLDPTSTLKSKLRKLVTAQENHWAEHGTYTTDVAALGMFTRSAAGGDSILVQVIQAGGRSWWGRVVHRLHRDRSCVIYVGLTDDFAAPPATDGTKVKAQGEAEPACDPF